jgi:hypothetical protein
MQTGLTDCIYRSDRLADPEADQACLRPAHEQVLRCVTGSHVNTLFGDSAGDKEAFIGYYG